MCPFALGPRKGTETLLARNRTLTLGSHQGHPGFVGLASGETGAMEEHQKAVALPPALLSPNPPCFQVQTGRAASQGVLSTGLQPSGPYRSEHHSQSGPRTPELSTPTPPLRTP